MPSGKPPDMPRSLRILRQRVEEEMRKPGWSGRPQYESIRALARALDLDATHVSKFLRGNGTNMRGVSWAVIDQLAAALNVQIWELFFLRGQPQSEPDHLARLKAEAKSAQKLIATFTDQPVQPQQKRKRKS